MAAYNFTLEYWKFLINLRASVFYFQLYQRFLYRRNSLMQLAPSVFTFLSLIGWIFFPNLRDWGIIVTIIAIGFGLFISHGSFSDQPYLMSRFLCSLEDLAFEVESKCYDIVNGKVSDTYISSFLGSSREKRKEISRRFFPFHRPSQKKRYADEVGERTRAYCRNLFPGI